MNCPCDKLFGLYEEMLGLHIWTKTNDLVFHKASEWFYGTLFDVFHGISEAMQDSKMASPVDCDTAKKRSYEILMEAKSLVEAMVNENKDIAVDNVLRGLVDKLWFDCGTARGFSDWKKESPVEVKEESNEEESESEEPEEKETEESPEEDVEDDLMWSQMEKDSWYTYGSKEENKKNPSKEDELNKKRKGSTEYTVVSIMP